MVLTGIQQAACHGLIGGLFRCSDNRLCEDTQPETEMAAAGEVYFFCTTVTGAEQEKLIFRVISPSERCIDFLLVVSAYLPS